MQITSHGAQSARSSPPHLAYSRCRQALRHPDNTPPPYHSLHDPTDRLTPPHPCDQSRPAVAIEPYKSPYMKTDTHTPLRPPPPPPLTKPQSVSRDTRVTLTPCGSHTTSLAVCPLYMPPFLFTKKKMCIYRYMSNIWYM